MKPDASKDGIGPDAVVGSTYFGIQAEQLAAEAAARALKPGLEPEQVYTAGKVPTLPGGPSAQPDPLGKEPPLGWDVNGPDPSGVNRNRGAG